MHHRTRLVVASLAIVVVTVGCAGRAPGGPAIAPPAADDAVAQARAQFPRVLDMHTKIVARSCAPNAGVCHNTSSYPELSTAGALLDTVRSWCNVDIPDPTMGFDGCEHAGDSLGVEVIGADDQGNETRDTVFFSEVAWAERTTAVQWTLHLRDAAEADVDGKPYLYDVAAGEVVLYFADEWGGRVHVAAGSDVAELEVTGVADNPFIEDFIDDNLAAIVPGDPNRNGVFGADLHGDDGAAAVLAPGDLARSYLWGRITGTVPGSRMPLANQALTDAEYIALGCFIERLPTLGDDVGPDAPIDYDGCELAAHPQSFAVDAASGE